MLYIASGWLSTMIIHVLNSGDQIVTMDFQKSACKKHNNVCFKLKVFV